MDEEDGRTGARAAQTGPLDATCGVPTLSLQITYRNSLNRGASGSATEALFRHACKAVIPNEVNDENVPGK